MSQLKKLIVLTPEQLQRLRGRDRELTERSDIERRLALHEAGKQTAKVGPAQAYAQYRLAQERHLHHAAKERTEPLHMTIADVKQDTSKDYKQEEQEEKKQERKEEDQEREEAETRKKKKKKVKDKTRRVRAGRVDRPSPFPSPLKTRAKRQEQRKRQLAGWLQYGEI